MKSFSPWLLLGLLLSSWSHSSDAQTASAIVEQPHLRAQLLSEVRSVTPGQRFSVALKLMPEQGWHTYWMNPGDSGLATTLQWQLPEGAEQHDIQWPIAHTFSIGPVTNYGFEGETYLLTDLSVPDDDPIDAFSFSVQADWLVCEAICVPGSATFAMSLPVGSQGELAPEHQAAFATARKQLPQHVDWPAQFSVAEQQVVFAIDHPQATSMARAAGFKLYVGAGELVEHAHHGQQQISGDTLLLQRPRNTFYSGAAASIPLLLVSAQQAVLLTATQSQLAALAEAPIAANHTDPSVLNWLMMLLFAALGGLLLNLMPCVFPVLAIKALSFTSAVHARRAHAWWYSAGVVLSFVAIAAALLALRSAGAALGWGFQLQNPWLIAGMTLLFVAIGLNLSGLYQVATGVMGIGSRAGSHQRRRDSFATGILAVLVASPCTAPFMGVALGFAIVQPTPLALTVFAALGLGMALPFLVLTHWPWLAARMPKPGAWMERFKQWLALPMYLTAVWLLWVFGRQTGVDSMALLLIAVVLLATWLWWIGLRQQQPQPSLLGGLLALLLLSLMLLSASAALRFAERSESLGKPKLSHEGGWQVWSATRLRELRAQGQPVFVNMTADWCITCLANEKVALDVESTRALFAEHQISYLKGDWTLQDPAITEYLASFGRNGVPLYVLYWPGQPPQVLPQLLTPALVRERIEANLALRNQD